MPRFPRIVFSCSVLAGMLWLAVAPASPQKVHPPKPQARPAPPQDTGFLNRRITLNGVTYRFQVYLPEEWRRDDGKQWPIILSLHGRVERGSEGMWQTQVGIAEAVRSHPDRWPFIVVMPQCPLGAYWTDPAMLELATAALDRPDRAPMAAIAGKTGRDGVHTEAFGYILAELQSLARAHPDGTW